MIAVLVFANWSAAPDATGVWSTVHALKWWLTSASALALAVVLGRWFAFPPLGLAALGGLVALVALTFEGRPSLPFAAGIVGPVRLDAVGR